MQTISCILRNPESEEWFLHNDIGELIDDGLKLLKTPGMSSKARV
jgi:hypothetical protein